MPNEKSITRLISNHPLYFGTAILCVLFLAVLANFRKYDIPDTIEQWGQFGDFIGGLLNPIFGLISLVIISLTLQSQQRSSKKQEFDNQFFSLLTFYDSVLQSIDHQSHQEFTRKGRDCFYLFYKDIIRISKKNKVSLETAYATFFQIHGWEIEHYFRTVYHLFKHVKDGNATGLVQPNEKKKYYDLIKAQISQHELVLLWLNCHSQHKGKWDLLINDDQADPFEHLNKSLLILSPSAATDVIPGSRLLP